jgi:hypothetical protein
MEVIKGSFEHQKEEVPEKRRRINNMIKQKHKYIVYFPSSLQLSKQCLIVEIYNLV